MTDQEKQILANIRKTSKEYKFNKKLFNTIYISLGILTIISIIYFIYLGIHGMPNDTQMALLPLSFILFLTVCTICYNIQHFVMKANKASAFNIFILCVSNFICGYGLCYSLIQQTLYNNFTYSVTNAVILYGIAFGGVLVECNNMIYPEEIVLTEFKKYKKELDDDLMSLL